MNHDLLTIKIAFFEHGYSLLNKKWHGQTFNENYARLYCVTEGNAEIWHSKRYFLLKPGKLFLIPPNANMKFRCKESCRIIWLHFDLQIAGFSNIFDPGLCIYAHTVENPDNTENMMKKLISLMDEKDRKAVILAQGLFLQIISEFFHSKKITVNPKISTLTEKLEPVIRYIISNCNQKITMQKLAKIAGYEKTYFSSVFKKIYLVSPLKYLINIRIEKAKNMLCFTDEKLSFIAAECGFNDSFHLSKTFKKITGISPRDFRKKIFSKKP